MKLAYFDCYSGAAGNMVLGALLDCGLEARELQEKLRGLDLGDWELRVSPVTRRSVGGVYVEVLVGGRSADHAAVLASGSCHGRHHPHEHEHSSLKEILGRIRGSGLPQAVVDRSCRIFSRLAEAEARVHRTTPEEVLFHEVGAVDAVVDVVGSVLGLHLLGVEEVYCAPLPQGYGFVQAAHGRLPVPAPATAYLLQGVPLRFVDVDGELVTPTGAALLSTLARFETPPVFVPRAVGHGAGRSDFPHPNLLRLFVGETVPEGPEPRATLAAGPGHHETVAVVEANLDDMNPQLLGALVDRILAEGALDIGFLPLQMKKNRPATMLWTLVPEPLVERITSLILEETTTLGVRWHPVTRRTLARRVVEVETTWGPIPVKVSEKGHRAPEFEACREAAERHRVPLRAVYEAALAAALKAG